MSEGWWEDFQSVPLIIVMRLFLEEAVLSELQFPSSCRLRPIKLTEGGLGRQLYNLIACAFTCRSLLTLLATFLFSNACLVESNAFITPLSSYWFPPYHTTLPSLSPLPRPCSLSISPVTSILFLHSSLLSPRSCSRFSPPIESLQTSLTCAPRSPLST